MSAHYFDVERVTLAGTQLVEASAGTGKTYAISTLVVRLLLETPHEIDRILVVTFTEAATQELKDRVRSRIREALALVGSSGDTSDLARLVRRVPAEEARRRLEAALSHFDDAAILTIHGFCQRALLENAFASRVAFEAELVRDTRPLIEELVLDFWSREVGPAAPVFVEHLRDSSITPETLQEHARWVARTVHFEIVPELPARDGSGQRRFGEVDTTALSLAFDGAKTSFDVNGVLAAISGSDIEKARYKANHLPGWLRQIEDMFEDQRALPRLTDKFERFSTASLTAVSRSKTAPTHPFFAAADALLGELQRTKETLLDEELAFYGALVATLQRDFKRQKRERGLITFDDLLFDLYDALSSPRAEALRRNLRDRFPVALIDEFQDTDPVQYAIFRSLYGNRQQPLFLIGDPKQAIYSFRGADVFAYLRARAEVPSERRFTMEHNYRSDRALVDAVNALFAGAPEPFFFPELVFTSVKAREGAPPAPEFPSALELSPLQFRFLPSAPAGGAKVRSSGNLAERVVPDLVAREIATLLASDLVLGERRIRPKDIAVLTRTNAQAFDCQRALQRLRVPSVVLGDRSVFQYQEAHDLRLLLAAALEPQNQRALRCALATELLGVKVSELLHMETDAAAWDRWADRFKSYHQRWVSEGFLQMIRLAMAECGITERLLTLVDGERRMTNLLHLIELLHVDATTQHLGPSGLLHYLGEMLRRGEREAGEEREWVRLESDEDTVTLTTVHKSKGLEYGIVLCPYPFKDLLAVNKDRAPVHFHDQEKQAHVLALGAAAREAHLARLLDEALAENLRLLYVALTRAKHATIVFWGAHKDYEESALGYLLHSKDAQSLLGEPNREQVRGHLKTLDEQMLLERLRELSLAVPGIGVTLVDLEKGAPEYARETSDTAQLVEREPRRRSGVFQHISSFTELAHSSSQGGLGPSEGRDHDETLVARAPQGADSDRCRLADFPGGAQVGNFFHAVLERWDFSKKLPEALVREQLLAHGLPLELEELASAGLVDCVKADLQRADAVRGDAAAKEKRLRLCDIEFTARTNELEFYLPVGARSTFGSASETHDLGEVGARALARVFEAHPSAELPESYVERLSELRFVPLRGFLKGYIDLVFEHGGKWYVVDYKSNHLGECYADYGADALARCMSQNHYYLQYHLYSVALHRLLSSRKPGYDFDRDFGGVYYLFLRGMRDKQRTGVFFEKPPRERLDALSRLFAREASP